MLMMMIDNDVNRNSEAGTAVGGMVAMATGAGYSGGFRGGAGGATMAPPRPPSKIILAVWSRYKSSICRIYLFQS